ncbi:MAG: chromosomal replication initiator protein DnaA [Treponema sp.]|nr:chromosomal replication initiator protein DnaA [Spirochaetia bacterium]MDD7534512.1 chromosomal replication initiator protein DnaA [Treponema sp.]MDY3721776.1 chromosomal replication initiator protein DnaA [Treponema sp.]MDY5758190.1 chromosomal replication initiator protein DnaA [Treponema sp.]MDY5816820.1 chromosomal replication initiator protein DnaA [Treponema sp.]
MSERIYEEAWEYTMKVLHDLYKSQNKEDEFKLWFNMNYVEDTIDTITVSVASSFLQQTMQKKGNFDIVLKKLKEITGQEDIRLNCIVVKEELSESKKSESLNDEKPSKKSVELETSSSNSNSAENKKANFKKHQLLQEEYTFDTFIPGDNSNFAYNASIAVAKNPGKQYNPILLYGGSGLGKTHLMQAIGNYIYNNGGEKLKICYVSAETFTNEFTVSIKEGKTNAFKNKYRNLDVLLLDDIHFLQNKEQTQEELFYTFNALHEKKAQMVFTCDRPIKEIKNMAARLVSRLANGLCIDLQPPSYETRVAILQKKIDLMDKTLSQDIVEYIAKNIETNVRDLEAALNKVFGYADLVEKKPDLEITKHLLKDVMDSGSTESISIDVIQKVIADNYQISVADLKGKKRDKKFVIPRQIAIYVARELTEMAYTDIGNEFGGKDHSTIMSAYNKIAEQIKIDSSLESKIQLYIREIKEYKK